MTRAVAMALLFLSLSACDGREEPEDVPAESASIGCTLGAKFVAGKGAVTNICPPAAVEDFIRDSFERNAIVGNVSQVSCSKELAAKVGARAHCRVTGSEGRTSFRVAVAAVQADVLELELGPIGIVSGPRGGY